jgi:imidazoleglycerol phosphate dehydratase HisB
MREVSALFGHWVEVFIATYPGRAFRPPGLDASLPHHFVEGLAGALAAFVREEIDGARQRYGYAAVSMDGTLVLVSINVCRRTHASIPPDLRDMPGTDAVPGPLLFHFLETVLLNLGQNVALAVLAFDDAHHLMEAFFKALALAIHCLRHGLVHGAAEDLRRFHEGGEP